MKASYILHESFQFLLLGSWVEEGVIKVDPSKWLDTEIHATHCMDSLKAFKLSNVDAK